MTRGTKTRTNHIWRQMVFAIAAAAALATAEATASGGVGGAQRKQD